ncbi:hypothetical protein AMAG_04162 [Allomyces macrogynus ATCC 38327]|uniref:DNA helicase n=1 Tax=Allomyces macrogynus (strain ATCC 38327) TaxID=578462 RepID=A0A0L0S7N6_ALLM3|nr:hypothetical protein AMAG_04162 [Allomyces macrogynus ATCC 38327]|eukprot:KNE58598.1 hypothetical protein AMAG_04162 [Allomyces macrogynus ATCC 38327]
MADDDWDDGGFDWDDPALTSQLLQIKVPPTVAHPPPVAPAWNAAHARPPPPPAARPAAHQWRPPPAPAQYAAPPRPSGYAPPPPTRPAWQAGPSPPGPGPVPVARPFPAAAPAPIPPHVHNQQRPPPPLQQPVAWRPSRPPLTPTQGVTPSLTQTRLPDAWRTTAPLPAFPAPAHPPPPPVATNSLTRPWPAGPSSAHQPVQGPGTVPTRATPASFHQPPEAPAPPAWKQPTHRADPPAASPAAIPGATGIKDDDHSCIQGVPERPSDEFLLEHASCMHSFDPDAIVQWIYPTNMPVRDYQINIVQKALFNNTLVSIPTGLGKTLIAAVVMLNFYMWFPEGKIVFMAPTRPLVAQQQSACYKITGIPIEDMVVFVGTTISPEERKHYWQTKRVFFTTPHNMANDLNHGTCPGKDVVLIVVDEAHRATGQYPYVPCVRELLKFHQDFRVLALSATPGSRREQVQEVISNLLINRIEIRTEESADLMQYTFKRVKQSVVVSLSGPAKEAHARFVQFMRPIAQRLKSLGVSHTDDPDQMSSFGIMARAKKLGFPHGCYGDVNALQRMLALLETLNTQSLAAFRQALRDLPIDMQTSKVKSNKALAAWVQSLAFKEYVGWLGSIMDSDPHFVAHPKQAALERIVLEHFANQAKDDRAATGGSKIMIFAKFRNIVDEIAKILDKHRPLVRVMSFVGQSSHKATGRGLNQREQLAIIRQFQEGGYNVLVSTSVGEEGLDIGDIDLIICYDTSQSPVQMLQRMGRTGRKREGRVVCLLTAGKEEEQYKKSQDNYKSVQNMIQKGGLQLFDKPARMIPFNVKPVLIKCFLNIPPLPGEGDDEDDARPSKRGRRGGAKRPGAFLTSSEMVKFMAKFELPRDAPPVPELALTRYLGQQVLRPGKFIAPSVTSERFMDLLGGLHELQRTVIEEQLASATAFGAGSDDDYGLLTQVSDVAADLDYRDVPMREPPPEPEPFLPSQLEPVVGFSRVGKAMASAAAPKPAAASLIKKPICLEIDDDDVDDDDADLSRLASVAPAPPVSSGRTDEPMDVDQLSLSDTFEGPFDFGLADSAPMPSVGFQDNADPLHPNLDFDAAPADADDDDFQFDLDDGVTGYKPSIQSPARQFKQSPTRPPPPAVPPPPPPLLSPLVAKDPLQELDWCPRYLAAVWTPYGAPLPPSAYLDVSVVIPPRHECRAGSASRVSPVRPNEDTDLGALGPPTLGPTPSANPVTVATKPAATTPAATAMRANAVDLHDVPLSVTQGSTPAQPLPSSVTQGSTPVKPLPSSVTQGSTPAQPLPSSGTQGSTPERRPSFKPVPVVILDETPISMAASSPVTGGPLRTARDRLSPMFVTPRPRTKSISFSQLPPESPSPVIQRAWAKEKDRRRQQRRQQQLLDSPDALAAPPRRKLKRKHASSRDRAPKLQPAAAAGVDRGFLDLEAELSGSDTGAGSHDDAEDSDDSAGSLVDWIAETQMEPDTPTSRLALYRMAHPPDSPIGDDDGDGPLQLPSFLLRGRARLPPTTPRTPGSRTNDTYDSQDSFLAPSDEPEPASTSTTQVSLDTLEAQLDRDYRRRKRRRRERGREEEDDDEAEEEEAGPADEATTPPIRLRRLKSRKQIRDGEVAEAPSPTADRKQNGGRGGGSRSVIELLSDDDD